MTGCLKISGDSHMVVRLLRQVQLTCLFPSVQAGSEMNVGDYYQTTYNIKLNPNLPCLNVGGSGKPTYVPAELATVKRGQRKLKLDERQQAQMIREAAIKPLVSFASVCVNCELLVLHQLLSIAPGCILLPLYKEALNVVSFKLLLPLLKSLGSQGWTCNKAWEVQQS